MNSRYLRAVLAVVFITGVAGASFYVSTKISSSKSVSPNAPSSQPQAYVPKEDGGKKTVPVQKPAPAVKPDKGEKDDPPPRVVATQKPAPVTTPSYYDYAYPTTKPANNPTSTPTKNNSGNSGNENPSITPPPKNSGLFGSDSSDYSDAGDVKIGNDGKGAIAGTYLAPDGSRHVIDLPATKKAYQEMVEQKSTYLTSLSSQDLLKEAKLSCTPSKENNYCKEDIAKAQKIVFQENLILDNQSKVAIETARTQNEAVSDVTNINLSADELKAKYGTSDPAKILGEAKITSDKIPALVETRDKLLKFFDTSIPTASIISEICHGVSYCIQRTTRADLLNSLNLSSADKDKYNQTFKSAVASQETINQYLSNTPDAVLAQNACKDVKGLRPKEICEDNFKRTDLLEALDPKSPQYIAVVTEKKDMTLASQYADPKFSNTALAKIYCDGRPDESKCVNSFTRDTYLNSITNQSYKDAAISNWNSNLASLIPLVVGKTDGPLTIKVGSDLIKLDPSTVKDIKEINKDTQNAFAAFAYLTQGKSEATMKTSDQLAQQFDDLLKKNPKELDRYLSLYEQNPTKYTQIKTGTGKNDYISMYIIDPNLEENAIIKNQYNQIIKTQSLPGLSDNGVIKTWTQASQDVKNDARLLACEKEKTLSSLCSDLKILLHDQKVATRPEEVQLINTRLSQLQTSLDSKIKNPDQYLKELYNQKTGADNPLSTFGSDLATVDNSAIDKEIRDKALLAAQREINPYYNTRYAAGYTAPKNDDPKVQALANEYLKQRLVEETYTRGAGVIGGISTALAATALCAELGPGALVCGGVAGLAAAISNFVPILGTSTAKEIAQEQQAIKDINIFGYNPFNSDTAANLVQSIYSSQGAACDTVDGIKIGASCTTKDNQFALLDSIQTTNQSFGVTTSDFGNEAYQAQLSLQPFLNQQFDELQNENQRQAYINLAVAPIMGAVSAGVGSNIARVTTSNVITNFAVNQAASLGNSLIGAVQAQYQFDSTVSYIDTSSEIALETCQRKNGVGSIECKDELEAVTKENTEAAKNNMILAVVSDQFVDKAITIGTFTNQVAANLLTNPNTPKIDIDPLVKTDSTIISPELTQLLNLSDPAILKGNINNLDSITANNLIKSQTIGNSGSNTTFGEFINSIAGNTKTSTTDTSLVQAATIYKDLNSSEFTTKLNQLGFSGEDITLAQKIRDDGSAVNMADTLDQLRVANQKIKADLLAQENSNPYEIDQMIFADETAFIKSQSEKIVADAKKSLAAIEKETLSNAPPKALPDPKTAAEMLGISQDTLTKLDSGLNTIQREALFESIVRFNDENIKIESLNTDGSVTYTKDLISDSGNSTLIFETPKELPDTNIIATAQKNGIDITGKTIKEVQQALETKVKSDSFLSDSQLTSKNKEISSLLPKTSPEEITQKLQTTKGQKTIDRMNDQNYLVKDGFLDKLSRLFDNSLENQIITRAKDLGIDVNNKPLPQIVTELRRSPEVLVKGQSLVLENALLEVGVRLHPKRFREAFLELIRTNPNANLSEIKLEGGRFWSARYLDESYPGFKRIFDDISNDASIPFTEKEALIDNVRKEIVTRIKSNLIKNNPDFFLSNKTPYLQDTFIDFSLNRDQSISQIANYLNQNFMSDMSLIISDINSKYNTKIGLEGSAKDFVWFGVSQDSLAPISFRMTGNEGYSFVPPGKEILNAVFASELYGSIPDFTKTSSDYLPIIEQTTSSTPQNELTRLGLDKKKIDISGHVLKQSEIAPLDPKTSKPISMTADEALILSQYTFESVTSIEGLLSSLDSEQRAQLGNKVVNLEVVDTTIVGTNQAAGDVAGYSLASGAITEVTDPKLRAQLDNGWGRIVNELQNTLTNGLKEIDGFKTHEHAGDGVRGINTNEVSIEGIQKMVDLSNTFDQIIAKALNGDYGSDAIVAAKFINDKFAGEIFTKVGIGKGDTKITIYPGSETLAAEVSSNINVDQYLDNVKKYKVSQKAAGKEVGPIIGISEDIYNRFATNTPEAKAELAALNKAGLEILVADVDGHPAHFIKKIDGTTPTANPLKPNPIKKTVTSLLPKLPTVQRDFLKMIPEVRENWKAGIESLTSKIKPQERIKSFFNDLFSAKPKADTTSTKTTNNLKSAAQVIGYTLIGFASAFGAIVFGPILLPNISNNRLTPPPASPTVTVTSTVTVTTSPTPTLTPTNTPSPTPSQTTTNSVYDHLSGQSAELNLSNLSPDSKEYREISFLISIMDNYRSTHPEILGRAATQSEKDAFVNFIKTEIGNSEFSDILDRTITKGGSTQNFDYYMTNYTGRWFNHYNEKTDKNELAQCLGWQALVGDMVFSHYNEVNDKPSTLINLDGYSITYPNQIYNQDAGDIYMQSYSSLDQVQKGDTYIYGVHTGIILDKYVIDGKKYFLITESNSPKGASDGKPEGQPVIYLADEEKFLNSVGLSGTQFGRPSNRYNIVIPPSTPTQDILDIINQLQ